MARAITESARELGLGGAVTVVTADLAGAPGGWLARLSGPFELVFCDPPYQRVEQVQPALAALGAAGALADGALLVLEHSRRAPPTLPAGFGEIRTYRYGDTAVLLGVYEAGGTEEDQ